MGWDRAKCMYSHPAPKILGGLGKQDALMRCWLFRLLHAWLAAAAVRLCVESIVRAAEQQQLQVEQVEKVARPLP
jgi:hypothetical protein